MLRHKSERESHRVKQRSSVQLSLQPSVFLFRKFDINLSERYCIKKKEYVWNQMLAQVYNTSLYNSFISRRPKVFFFLFCFFLCYACLKRPIDGEKSNTVQKFMGFKGAILNPARLLRSGQQMTMSPLSIVTDQFVVFHLKFTIWSACGEAVGQFYTFRTDQHCIQRQPDKQIFFFKGVSK